MSLKKPNFSTNLENFADFSSNINRDDENKILIKNKVFFI